MMGPWTRCTWWNYHEIISAIVMVEIIRLLLWISRNLSLVIVVQWLWLFFYCLTTTKLGSGLVACRESVAPPNSGEAHQMECLWWWRPSCDDSCSQWQRTLGIWRSYPRDVRESTSQHTGILSAFLKNVYWCDFWPFYTANVPMCFTCCC